MLADAAEILTRAFWESTRCGVDAWAPPLSEARLPRST
jgi:hypothetical protein